MCELVVAQYCVNVRTCKLRTKGGRLYVGDSDIVLGVAMQQTVHTSPEAWELLACETGPPCTVIYRASFVWKSEVVSTHLKP